VSQVVRSFLCAKCATRACSRGGLVQFSNCTINRCTRSPQTPLRVPASKSWSVLSMLPSVCPMGDSGVLRFRALKGSSATSPRLSFESGMMSGNGDTPSGGTSRFRNPTTVSRAEGGMSRSTIVTCGVTAAKRWRSNEAVNGECSPGTVSKQRTGPRRSCPQAAREK